MWVWKFLSSVFSHLCLLLEGFVPQMKFQHTFLTRLNYFPRENTLSCHVKIFFDVKKTSGNQTITIRKTKSFHFLIFQKSEFWGLEEVCLKTEIWIWRKNAFLAVFMNLWFFPKWKGICQKGFIMLEKHCWSAVWSNFVSWRNFTARKNHREQVWSVTVQAQQFYDSEKK